MRIGFISDIHEDIQNLRGALKILNTQQVDEVVCLGDIVGYSVPNFRFMESRDAAACVQLAKSHCCKVIPGNHDLYAIRKTPEFRGGFNFGTNWYNQDYKIRQMKGEDHVWLYEETELSALLSQSEKTYLHSLPETESLQTDALNLGFTHYIYPNASGSEVGFVREISDFEKHLNWMKKNGFNFSFSGHGHIEGLVVATEKNFDHYDFGQTVKMEKFSAVIGPCIARGKKETGIMIFDTGSFEVTALQIPED
jgi:predicted phosphodiesterase